MKKDYIVVDGVKYERVEGENIEIEIEDEHVEFLEKLVSDGLYVSKQEVIRDILRREIESKSENGSILFGNKKFLTE
jgi:metal-responsive CopG/Arc/MetJ family transcriptional regulator